MIIYELKIYIKYSYYVDRFLATSNKHTSNKYTSNKHFEIYLYYIANIFINDFILNEKPIL